MSMVPGEVSVGTAAPQATSAGGRHLAPAQCGTAPPGLHECFLGGIPPHPKFWSHRECPLFSPTAVCVCGGVLVPSEPWQHFEGVPFFLYPPFFSLFL